MTDLFRDFVQQYREKDIKKSEESFLYFVLTCNKNIKEGKSYNHDVKNMLFMDDCIKNPLGRKYSIEDYSNINNLLLSTLQILRRINTQKISTSNEIKKDLPIDSRILGDIVDLVIYTHVLHKMNKLNSTRIDNCEISKLPFVEQMLTILIFFQDQVRLLRQSSERYLGDDYITGMEFTVADKPIEFCDNSISSISDSLECTLDATNEIIHYLYYQNRKNLKSQVLDEEINFQLIQPYKNKDFLRYLYIALQRRMLYRVEEGIRYGYYTFESTGKEVNGIQYFHFSLENENKYRSRRLGVLRREYQYQQHALVNTIAQTELDEAYVELNTQAGLLVKVQVEGNILMDLSQFKPVTELFLKVEQIMSPKLCLVEQLTKKYYLECQVKDVKIRDLLCTYTYLSTLAEIAYAASLQLIDQDEPCTYAKEICLVNTSYLYSELSRIHNYSLKYAKKLINRFVFHEKDNKFDDIFAQPLLKISDTQVLLSQALLEQVNLDRAVERQFIRFEQSASDVGRYFEDYFINSLAHGYSQDIMSHQRRKIPNFELNVNKIEYVAFDGKNIEFDMIAKLGDYILLTELKAVMTSYGLADLESRRKNVKAAIKQLDRRAESLIHDWSTIRSMVSIDLPVDPIDPDHIILVACTDTYDYTPTKEGNVYITDESTFLMYFTNPNVQMIKVTNKTAEVITLKKLWSKGYPDADEFIAYLQDPQTIHPLADCMVKKSVPGIIIDEQDYLLMYEDYFLADDPIRSMTLEANC